MIFSIEIQTDLRHIDLLLLLERTKQLFSKDDSINSLTLDLSQMTGDFHMVSEVLNSLIQKLVLQLAPFFNLTLRLNESIFSQITLTNLLDTEALLLENTELTLELTKDSSSQNESFYDSVLDLIAGFKKSATRKFEIDVFFTPHRHGNKKLTSYESFLMELESSSKRGVNTLVRYIDANIDISIQEQLGYWRDFFKEKFNESFMFNALIPNFESRKSLIPRYTVLINRQGVSLGYCIYNRFFLDGELTPFSNLLEREALELEIEKSQRDQFNYASQTKSCTQCHHLQRCVEGRTLNYMKSNGLTDCQYPDSLVRALSK